ncbi:MAG: hypothetical protein DRJ65_19685 [Acidobacteria bacterium]|nr:MAG: hypothetical protein DRJ65_19685 [Acidobacteriota bacterium]
MSSEQDIFFDPWLKKCGDVKAVPSDAEFLCAFELDLCIDEIPVSTYLRQTETRYELWTEWEDGCGVVVSIPKKSSLKASPGVLFDHYFRSIAGFERPGTFLRSGLVTEPEYTQIYATIKFEREAARREALESRTEIVDVAEELGLHPRPTGGGADQWMADCPGTKHHLYVVSSTNSFGCGYCRRKGGANELRAFVEDRRIKDKQRRNQL